MSHEKSGIATSVTDNVRPSLSPKRTPITKTDELDILSAVWILSCNDDNPIMTYQGISDRLNLPEGFDVKALVAGRRELFRTGLLESRLTGWKQEMRAGSHRPGWMVKISDESDRLRAIE